MEPKKMLLTKKTSEEILKEVLSSTRDNPKMMDVTLDELGHLANNPGWKPIIDLMRSAWIGDDPEREFNTRIGHFNVFVDEDGFLRCELVTRFKVKS